MKLLTLPLLAGLIAGVAADFQIYVETALNAAYNGDQSTSRSITLFDGEPSCDDANCADPLPVYGDASGGGAARCDGCGDGVDSDDWDIKELELNAGRGFGHYTIYQSSGYQLTPADGGDLQGYCVRDSGDTYDCTTGLANTHGSRMFKCYSSKGGLRAINC